MAFGLLGIVVRMVATTILDPPGGNADVLLEYSLPGIVAGVLRTAITEEVLFRGYVIERLEELTRWLLPAVAFGLLVFVVPHVLFFGRCGSSPTVSTSCCSTCGAGTS